MRKRKIAIVGAGLTWEDAPYDKKGWEFWSMNNLYNRLPASKFSRWYELHSFEMKDRSMHRRGVRRYGAQRVSEYLADINRLDIPVYMQKKWKRVAKSRVLPFERIMKKYGRYFGCSFAWMTAHALYEHEQGRTVDTIGYYGVDLIGLEYYKQRPSTEYFIGLAKGMGINIEIAEGSHLMQMDGVYAYDENFLLIDELYVNPPESLRMVINYYQAMQERKVY